MADQPVAIDGISDPTKIRVKLLASGRDVHAPLDAVADAAIPASIHAAPSKTTPVDADEFGIADSAAGFSLAKLTWANLKEGIRAFLYGASKATPVDGDVVGILDSATSFSPKYVTWANLKATLKTYFDTLYVALTGNQTVAGIKTFSSIPVLSGGAIAFPATQVPSAGANDLDDYEEGTFTPAFAASGSTFSYTLQNGTYTKIGRVVHFAIALTLNTSGNTLTANALTITGMPFTNASTVSPLIHVSHVNATTSYVRMFGRATAGTTTLELDGITAAAVSDLVAVLANGALHATNGSTIRATGFYHA